MNQPNFIEYAISPVSIQSLNPLHMEAVCSNKSQCPSMCKAIFLTYFFLWIPLPISV